MKLYNTLTRKLEDFQPIEDNTVRLYSCGPTVYDHAHIGNLSAYIFADTLRRVLAHAGYQVKHVMNYTDVDDKTIRRSREKYPDIEPREALKKLTEEYIQIFNEDMKKMGNNIDTLTFVRATDTVDGMKELITKLHSDGFAYVADDGVYFSIEAYRKNGKTYGQLLELTTQNTSEARIQNDEYDKESVHDFALWKTKKEGEPAWEFSLAGKDLAGRPGWHIECSVMSRQELGQPFDIHTGGVDLIFPHHENEIAQSTALEENPVMAKFFVHNEHILVDGKKMSKSAQNFYTLEDVIKKGYDPLAFRLLVLQSHYRKATNFTWDNLSRAQDRLNDLRAFADQRWQIKKQQGHLTTEYKSYAETLATDIQNDLATPVLLSEIYGVARDSQQDPVTDAEEKDYLRYIELLDSLFGLRLLESQDIKTHQKALIAERETARQAQDWAKSDKLRDQLAAEYRLGVRDTQHGPIWYRV